MKYDDIIKKLKYLSNPKSIEGMAKYGITPKKIYGVSIPDLRKFVRKIQKMNSSSAKWIASDAIRELTSKAVQKRLRGKTRKKVQIDFIKC